MSMGMMPGPGLGGAAAAPSGASYVGIGSFVLATRLNDLTVTGPVATQAGDVSLLILASGATGGSPLGAVSGWTMLPGYPVDSGNGCIGALYWQRATANTPATVTIPHDSVAAKEGVIETWRGCATAPVDTSAVMAASATGTLTAPSVTTSSDNCSVIQGVIAQVGAAVPLTAISNAALNDFTQRYNQGSAPAAVIADGVLPNAGASGSGVCTDSQPTARGYVAFTVALTPA